MFAAYIHDLHSFGLKGLPPKEAKFPQGDTVTIPLNWKLRLHSGHFELFLPLEQQAMKGVTMMVWLNDPNYPGEAWLLL